MTRIQKATVKEAQTNYRRSVENRDRYLASVFVSTEQTAYWNRVVEQYRELMIAAERASHGTH